MNFPWRPMTLIFSTRKVQAEVAKRGLHRGDKGQEWLFHRIE